MVDSLDRGNNDEEPKAEPFSSLPSRAAHAADLKNSAPDTLTGLGPLTDAASSEAAPSTEADSEAAKADSAEVSASEAATSADEPVPAPAAAAAAIPTTESESEPEPVDASEVEDAEDHAPEAEASSSASAEPSAAAEPDGAKAASSESDDGEVAEEIEDAEEIDAERSLDAAPDSEGAGLGDADDDEPTRVLVPSSLDELAREARPSSARRTFSPPSRDRLVSDDDADEFGHGTQEAQLLNAALQKLSSSSMPAPPRPPSRTMTIPPRPPSSVPLSALVTHGSPSVPSHPPPLPSSPFAPSAPMMPAPPSLTGGAKLPPPPVLEPPRLAALSDAPVSLPTPAKTRPSLRRLGDGPAADEAGASGRRGSSRSMLVTGGAVFAVSALLSIGIAKLVLPAKGAVAVSVVDSENNAVPNAEVLLDGQPACAPAPCKTGKLSTGKHTVAVRAPGYGLTEQEVEVQSGDTELKFVLDKSEPAGLHVRVPGEGFRIYLDGEDRGSGSVTLAGLRPRTATLRVAGHPLYAAYEQQVELVPGKTITVEPKLVPVKAVITIEPGPGAEGASVEVVEPDGSRRAVTQLPARIEVRPGEQYRVRASRPGFSDYETQVIFGDSEAEKTVRVQFVAAGAPPVVAPVAPAQPRPAAPVAPAAPVRPAPAAPAPAAPAPARPVAPAPVANATAKGTLSINSIPLSNVLVDGRPVGATPRKLELSPGKHSVVFVHPTMGRKTVTVEVQPGKTSVASVKF